MACHNRNLPEYKDLMKQFKSNFVVDGIIDVYQKSKGPETIPTVAEGLEIVEKTKANHSLKVRNFRTALTQNLVKKGYITGFLPAEKKKAGEEMEYYVVGTRKGKNEDASPVVRNNNVNKIKNYLRMNNINPNILGFETTNNSIRVNFFDNLFKPQDLINTSKDKTNVVPVLDYLMQTIPGLRYEVMSAEEARKVYDKYIPNFAKARTKDGKAIPFERVNSFYYNGVAIIIDGKVTTETAIEEVLHPFVEALVTARPDIYGNFVFEARKSFPVLAEQIDDRYSSKYGFTEFDRQKELVTQALSRYFKKEYETQPRTSLKTAVKEILDWFASIIEQFYNRLTGGNLTINLKDLSAETTFSDLAKLLNTEELSFDINIKKDRTEGVKYNVDENDPAIQAKETARKNARSRSTTAVQKDMIDLMYNTPVILQEDNHVYMNLENGQEYTSTTTAMKGGMNDPKDLYKLNRLFGKDFDSILQDLIENKSFEDAFKNITEINKDIAKEAYDSLKIYIDAITQDGSVVLPQVIFADDKSKIAGSLDVLVIKPNGDLFIVDLKVSKNSISDEDYSTRKYPTNEGSLLPNTQLTTRQQHSIQVQTYAKLAEVNGFPVSGTSTYHIRLDIEGEADKQKVKGFEVEGVVQHLPTENLEYVNKILPTEPSKNATEDIRIKNGYNATRNPNFTTKEEDQPEDEMSAEQYSSVAAFMKEVVSLTATKIDALKAVIDSAKQIKPKKETIDKITSLNAILTQELATGKADLAFGRFLNESKKELEAFIKYSSDPKNYGKSDFISRVLMFSKYMETYRGLKNFSLTQNVPNTAQRNMAIQVIELLNIADGNISDAIQNYVKEFIRTNSTKDWTEEELDEVLKETKDISNSDRFLGDLATSTDTLLALLDKVYKRQRQKIQDESEDFAIRAARIGDNLARLSGGKQPDFSFMLVYNDKNEFTGRYVRKIGYQYYKKLYALRNELVDEKGEWMNYISIPNIEDATPEELAFNRNLLKKKQAYRNFKNAEKVVDGKYQDGDFHRYTQEFKNERDKYEYFNGKRWKKKRGIADEEYALYRNKYYSFSEFVSPLYDKTGDYQGATRQSEGWFVKPEFVEVREMSATGENMLDPKYEKIMNPTTELGRAQKEFYEFWTEEFENKQLNMLPPSVKKDMIGKLPRIRRNLGNKLKKEPSSFVSLLGKAAGDYFKSITDTGYQKVQLTDLEGNVIDAPPIFYTGNLKNQYVIDKIKKELEDLESVYNNGKLSTNKYIEKKKALKKSLKANESKLSTYDLSTNLVDSVIKFNAMATNYKHLLNMDDSLYAIQRTIENRQYIQSENKLVKTLTGEKKFQTVEGKESRTYSRLKKWMKMVYYDESQFDRTILDNVIQKVLNNTSLAYVGFNIFGNINNYIIGRINNGIETGGELFYKKKAMLRTTKVYNSEYLPGVFTGLSNSKGYYSETNPGSKYEALMRKFRMVDSQAMREIQREKGPLDWGYALQDAAENNVQSKVGMAILMSKELKNDNGDTLSIYDAYDFDPNTGELKLKEGYELSDEERYDIRNVIREANKQIHGNYSREDRMAIQDSSLGQMIAQFHKWVYPAYKARFQPRYYDENLGWVEGRYRSLVNFLGHVYQAKGSIAERIRDGKEDLSEDQLKNLSRVMYELGFILTSFITAHMIKLLIDGMDFDDDDKELKRLMNALAFQADRQSTELTQFVSPKAVYMLVKNPIASSKFLGEMGEAIQDSFAFPFSYAVDPESVFYQRGARKGDLKLAKQWADVVPGWYTINRWRSYDNVTDFFVK
jgi:hypothetical protein